MIRELGIELSSFWFVTIFGVTLRPDFETGFPVWWAGFMCIVGVWWWCMTYLAEKVFKTKRTVEYDQNGKMITYEMSFDFKGLSFLDLLWLVLCTVPGFNFIYVPTFMFIYVLVTEGLPLQMLWVVLFRGDITSLPRKAYSKIFR